MSKLKIGIIIGSTRQGRFADTPANWIKAHAEARGDMEVELVDLRDFPMPFFDEAWSPAWGPSSNEVAQAWQRKVDSLDGFIVTAAEYNHAPTGVLKNALDYAFNEWKNKPVSFVAYGGVGGARAVEQLRMIAVEVEMAPIRNAVHIVLPDFVSIMQGKKMEEIEHLNAGAKAMLDQLAWWGNALKAARLAGTKAA